MCAAVSGMDDRRMDRIGGVRVGDGRTHVCHSWMCAWMFACSLNECLWIDTNHTHPFTHVCHSLCASLWASRDTVPSCHTDTADMQRR
mmetsp:Transcript_29267/g.84659  ORF Transcript_29267/g.84659 Transcript_29267/m.84659 type:complete len:88 (-) Transcript_29267:1804-2067(-)